MQTVTFNNREMRIHSTESIDGALGEDLQKRGFEPVFYTLVGKRGGMVTCLKSIKTGDMIKF